METDKKISTFTQNEEETMKKLDAFEAQMKESLLGGESIASIEYYEQLKVTDKLEVNANVYIAKINQEDGTTRTGIYAVDSNNLIGYLNEDGKIEFIDPLLRSLEIEITLEELQELNYENLKVKAEELTPEEMEEYLKNKKENDKKNDKDKVENEKDEDKEAKAMEEKMEKETGKKYEFSYYRKIRTPGLQEGLKSAKGKDCALAADRITGQMMIIDTGKGDILQGTGMGKATMRTAITLNDNAERVERKNLHALIKTNENDKEVGITLGQYGEPELYSMEVTPCGERFAERKGMEGQGRQHIDSERRAEINNHKEKYDVTHNYEETEDIHSEEISKDTPIELGDGTTTTLEKEAEKAKVTAEEFINKYKITEGKTPEEKIENVHEEIETEYGAPRRNKEMH